MIFQEGFKSDCNFSKPSKKTPAKSHSRRSAGYPATIVVCALRALSQVVLSESACRAVVEPKQFIIDPAFVHFPTL